MLTKSEKSNACCGVFGPPKSSPPAPPGVVIIDDGSAEFFGGGVEGGFIGPLLEGFAGEGDVAR